MSTAGTRPQGEFTREELERELLHDYSAGLAFGAACLALVWLLTPLISALFREPGPGARGDWLSCELTIQGGHWS